MAFDPSMQLSETYTLGDFTRTDHKSINNNPTKQEHVDNLKLLADMKEQLDAEIGPSKILSGFRSYALQTQLAKETGAAATPGTSPHEQGLAMDLMPTSQGLATFFGLILGNPDIREKLGQIAIKPTQNSVHLSLATPDHKGEALFMDVAEHYRPLTQQEEINYIKPAISVIQLTILVALTAGFWWWYKKKGGKAVIMKHTARFRK